MLTKAEIEIATNLINGKWHAYSNSEHEQIGQVAVGLAPQKVQARELLGDKGIGRLRRPVSRGGSHPIAKQPSRRAGRPTTTTSTT